MSNITARMNWPYPEQDQDPWFDGFEAFATSVDASGYAAREDRQLIVTTDAVVSFNSTSGLLSWSAGIILTNVLTGFALTIPTGSITLNDGQIGYLVLTRNLLTNLNVTLTVVNTVPNTDDALVFCIRRGSSVYFVRGNRISNGQSLNPFATSSSSASDATDTVIGITKLSVAAVSPSNPIAVGDNDPRNTNDRTASGIRTNSTVVSVSAAAAPSVGQTIVATSSTTATWQTPSGGGSLGTSGQTLVGVIWAGGRASLNSATPMVVGAVQFDPTVYALTGTTFSVRFRAVAAVGNAGLTGHVKLVNVTDAEDVATENFTTTALASAETTLTIGAGTGNIKNGVRIYEVQIWVDSPVGPGDTIELYSATLRAVNTIT